MAGYHPSQNTPDCPSFKKKETILSGGSVMNSGASLDQNPLELFTKWSEGHLGLLNQRQQMFKEATESFLGVFRESFEMKVPEESLKRLCGNMLEMFKLPLNTLGDPARLDAYSSELKKLVAAMPVAISGNGFSEELRQYGKASWANGSKAHSACMSWMMSLLHDQKLTSDRKEAEEAVKSCLEATELFLEKSFTCCLDQVRANCVLVKTGILKDEAPAAAAQ